MSTKAIKHIQIDRKFQGYMDQLEFFYRDQGQKINWYKIKSITETWGKDYLGVYSTRTNRIKIDSDQILRYFKSSGHYHKVMMVVLAHEIAHSQGIEHTENPWSIMFPGADYILQLIEKKSLSSLLLTPYRI